VRGPAGAGEAYELVHPGMIAPEKLSEFDEAVQGGVVLNHSRKSIQVIGQNNSVCLVLVYLEIVVGYSDRYYLHTGRIAWGRVSEVK